MVRNHAGVDHRSSTPPSGELNRTYTAQPCSPASTCKAGPLELTLLVYAEPRNQHTAHSPRGRARAAPRMVAGLPGRPRTMLPRRRGGLRPCSCHARRRTCEQSPRGLSACMPLLRSMKDTALDCADLPCPGRHAGDDLSPRLGPAEVRRRVRHLPDRVFERGLLLHDRVSPPDHPGSKTGQLKN